MRVIMACAGTAGHINPAIAIANKIKQEDKNAKIIFIRSYRPLEQELIPKAGYELKKIHAYGMSKKINLETIKKTISTIKGYFEAKKIIKQFKPDIVIGTGGYICRPVILAASKQKIPTMLHESNAYPGKAIKMLSKYTSTILVSFEEAKKYLNHSNIVNVGTPVKIKKIDYTKEQKEKLYEKYNLDKTLKTVLVFGGSQGAKKINDTVLDMIEKNDIDFNLIWATRQDNFELISNSLNLIGKEQKEKKGKKEEKLKNINVMPYIYDMEEVMNLANLVISRAGAMTISEIAALNTPAILIPLPNVSNDHQLYNAKVLANIGAGKIILNDELNNDNLYQAIIEIIDDEQKEKDMINSSKQIEIKPSQELIYEQIQKLVNKS